MIFDAKIAAFVAAVRRPMLVLLAAVHVQSTAARAEFWPGRDAPPGGAIAAQVIGEHCTGFLTAEEVGELADYVGERAEAFSKGSEAERGYPAFFPRLASAYRETYSQPHNCTATARDMARDMLERVRRARSGGATEVTPR